MVEKETHKTTDNLAGRKYCHSSWAVTVTSNELDVFFLQKAKENAKRENVTLTITNFDWRNLTGHLKEECFDALTCLGNSLTYLFTRRRWEGRSLL